MKKQILLFLSLALLTLAAGAQTRVIYPDDFAGGWQQYVGQTVTFTNRFYLGGFNDADGRYTDAALLTDMRRTPSDVATPGTDEYTAAEAASDALWNTQVRLSFGGGEYWLQRIGSYVDGLTATVTGERTLRVSHTGDVPWQPGRPTERPSVGNADVVVCGANLQNFTPWIGKDWLSSGAPKTQEEADLQTAKVINALYNINADIYAFCELQDTVATVDYIAQKLNERYGVDGLFAGVNDGQSSNHLAAGRTGYVYRTTTVRPVGAMGYPDAGNYVYSRHQYVQQFEQLSNGGRFALAVNHFKAKSADSDPERVRNMNSLLNYLRTAPSLDDDVLVVGDLNTYSREEPILMIEEEGYENLLSRYHPEGFSYLYQDEVGNLDHALASASLASQVTGAAVYQLNAEESWYYKRGGRLVTDDMYGYADHNPVVVGLSLEPEADMPCENIDYSETFASSLGAFTSVNVKGKSKDWHIHSKGYANMNGYGGDNPNEDWLVSPAFDLTDKQSATLTFQHTIGYCSDKTIMRRNHTLWVTASYTGDPTTTEWTQLDINKMPAGTNATYVTPTVDIPAEYLKEGVQFAFKYLSDGEVNGNWCIKNLTFRATCAASGVDAAPEEAALRWSATDNIIYMYDLPVGAGVSVYDLTGKRIAARTAQGGEVRLPVPAAGMYIVNFSDKVYKVVVK